MKGAFGMIKGSLDQSGCARNKEFQYVSVIDLFLSCNIGKQLWKVLGTWKKNKFNTKLESFSCMSGEVRLQWIFF